jgi:hypothetical protein
MTVNISRITTATSVALQASENSATSETNIDDTLLTENVQTAAGQQTLSRQAIDRGTGIEDVVMMDLQRRYATTLDSTIVNQATTGLLAVATDVAYTDATPTGAELYPKLLAGASGSEAALLGQATPDVVVMHSRRWYWLSKEMTNDLADDRQPGNPDASVRRQLRRAVRVGIPGAPAERHGRGRRQQPADEPRRRHGGLDRDRADGGVLPVGGPERSAVHPGRAARRGESWRADRAVRLLRVHAAPIRQLAPGDHRHRPHRPRVLGITINS